MRMFLIASAATLGLASLAPVQAQDPVPAKVNCRDEVMQLCGSDRSKLRSCMKENFGKLSDECQTRIKERMEARRSGDGDKWQHRSGAAGGPGQMGGMGDQPPQADGPDPQQ